jgi:uncharacterized protein (TIGR02217 family)
MPNIIVFADVVLRNAVLAANVVGRSSGMNRRIEQISGAMQINVMRDQALREWEWATVPLRCADWQYMATLHEVTNYGANGFLMEDPTDSVVAAGQGLVDSLTSTTFQLYKRYTHASRTKDRKITRPWVSAFDIRVSGVPVAHTLDTETGIVTIASAPAEGTVTWTGRFYVPVHFMSDTIDWTLVVPGQDPDARFLTGPNVVLREIRE